MKESNDDTVYDNTHFGARNESCTMYDVPKERNVRIPARFRRLTVAGTISKHLIPD